MEERFVKLTEAHQIKPFECGKSKIEADLTEFLHKQSKLYLKEKMGTTYLIENDTDTISYCTILNDKISMSVDEKKVWNRINRNIKNEKHQKSYPAIKIGSLATNCNYAQKGYASYLIDFVKNYLLSDTQFSGCRFITVDAYNTEKVLAFYFNYGFRFFSEKDCDATTRSMYLDICK